MNKIPSLKQLPENPTDRQLKAIAAHIIHLNNPKFNGVTVKTLSRDKQDNIVGTFVSDGSRYKFDLDTDDLFLSFAPDNAPISLSGGEIHDYIEFINATDAIANPADELTDKLAPLIQPEINAMIGAIADQLFSSDDLGLAQEKIAGLYGQLKTDTLAKQFSLSMEAARLVGAYDAQTDIEDQEIDLELELDESELIDFKKGKIKEGTTKAGKNGVTLVLTNSRWRRQTNAEAAAAGTSGGATPKAAAASSGDAPAKVPTAKDLLKKTSLI